MQSQHLSLSRRLLWLAAIVLLAASAGCGWFGGKKKRAVYEMSPEARPLELPPDLDMPQANPEMVIPPVAPGRVGTSPVPSAAPPAAGTAATASAGVDEFVLDDTRESAFRRLGLALNRVEGVNVASASQLLGSFEVQYQGQDFLIRIQEHGQGVRIDALTTDGRPITTGPATQLLAQLRQRLT